MQKSSRFHLRQLESREDFSAEARSAFKAQDQRRSLLATRCPAFFRAWHARPAVALYASKRAEQLGLASNGAVQCVTAPSPPPSIAEPSRRDSERDVAVISSSLSCATYTIQAVR